MDLFMKKYLVSIALLSLLVSACNIQKCIYEIDYEYGIFLGASKDDIHKIEKYHNVCIDIDEFESSDISYLNNKNINVYAYLSIGSLETYRDYYEEFKDYCFYDYENWPDEKWIDISQESWKEHLYREARRFKNLGAIGLFMDNFDVYYIASEEYEGDKVNAEEIYTSCIEILNRLFTLDLSLIINSGSTLLERINEENPSLLDKIDCYTQECVFSNIKDYDHDIFTVQDKDTRDYYQSVISFMKEHSDILLLEYTKDYKVIDKIVKYCHSFNYHYYISKTVDLK